MYIPGSGSKIVLLEKAWVVLSAKQLIVVDKRLSVGMSWQGTATRWPFSAVEYVIAAVTSEKSSYLFTCVMSQSACTYIFILAFSRGNAGELCSTWPSNRRISSSEDKEED